MPSATSFAVGVAAGLVLSAAGAGVNAGVGDPLGIGSSTRSVVVACSKQNAAKALIVGGRKRYTVGDPANAGTVEKSSRYGWCVDGQ